MAVASALSGPVCDSAADMVDFLQGLAAQDRLAKVDALRITPYWREDEADDLAAVRAQAEKILADLDLVRREEFDALRDMAARARADNEALAARVAALEAQLASGLEDVENP